MPWPAPFILLKPSFAMLAVAGIWKRAWWVGLAVLVVVSVPFAAQWVTYATVLQHADVPPDYSLVWWPVFLGLTAIWAGRSRPVGSNWRSA